MGLRINANDMGMNMLPGMAYAYTNGQNLPNDLYVYGVAERNGVHIFVDPDLPNCNELVQTINAKVGFYAVPYLVGSPAYRPAIGLARSVREATVIELTTKVVVMALYAANGRVDFSPLLTAPTDFQYQPGDLVYSKHGRKSRYTVENIEPFTVTRDSKATEDSPDNYIPCRPEQGTTARFLRPQRAYHLSLGLVTITPTDTVYVYAVQDGRVMYTLSNLVDDDDQEVILNTDVTRLIRVNTKG